MFFHKLNYVLTLVIYVLDAGCKNFVLTSSSLNEEDFESPQLDSNFIESVLSKYKLPPFPELPPLPSTLSNNPNLHNEVAVEWLDKFNEVYRQILHLGAQLDWDYNTNITIENAKRLSDYGLFRTTYLRPWRLQAQLFNVHRLPPDVASQIRIIQRGVSSLSPKSSRKLAVIHHTIQSMYNAGKVCLGNGTCLKGEPDLSRLMEKSRDPQLLLWAWKSWRDVVGPPMRKLYFQFIDLQNELSRSGGRTRINMGEIWRAEMGGGGNFEIECEHLYERIRPLYYELHLFVYRKLTDFYGIEVMGNDGFIPAHLLGNMWAQEWDELIDIVRPYRNRPLLDVTPEMQSRNFTPITMFKMAEDFFLSLGLEPMTPEFWERSMLQKPKDEEHRDVACHGSASNFYDDHDYRIRMCTEVTMEDLNTAHHEMGHVEYFMLYRHQPILFQDSANSAFHEAVGDTIQYSFLTPRHLHHVGLLKNSNLEDSEDDINFLMKQALMKLPLIPFSFVMDKWRWELFAGVIDETNANKRWWQLRRKYQGIKAPVKRTENDFDPGAKYHIPDNTPYIRYFISSFIQVQIHRGLCLKRYGGHPSIPLHRCSIYGSKEAGNLLKSVLRLGSSRSWHEALMTLTGESKVSADAILEYYEPLYKWLLVENSNRDETSGW